MHFEGAFWDLLNRRDERIPNSAISMIYFPYEVYLQLYKKFFFTEKNCKKVWGPDLTVDWCESNLQTLSLFASDNEFAIMQSGQLSADVIKWLIKNKSMYQDAFHLYFFFEKKNELWKTFSKEECDIIDIKEAKSWDKPKLIQLFSQALNVKLHEDEIKFLERIDFDIDLYFHFFTIISLLDENQSDRLSIVVDLISYREDKFNLLEMLSSKKFGSFFDLLQKCDNKEMVDFLPLAISHLSKMWSIESDAGDRPSYYEKQMLQHARKWKPEELRKTVHLLGQFLTKAKGGDPSLQLNLQKLQLRMNARV